MPPDFRPRSVSLYTIHVISVKVYLLKKSLSDKKKHVNWEDKFDTLVTCGRGSNFRRHMWLLRTRKLTSWLKSPDICWGRRGVRVFAYRKIHAIQPSGLFLTIFLTWHVPTSKIRRSACYGLKLLWHAKLQKKLPLGVKTEFWHNSGTVTGDNV